MFSDGQIIPLPILLHNVMTCEELLGKPKLFLLQACRGSANSFQGNLPISINSCAIDMENDADTSTNIIRNFKNRHAVVDTAEFWATPPDNQAFRTNVDVSFFIDKFCEIFDKFGKVKNFEEMVHLVNDEMSQMPPVYFSGKNYYLAPYFEGCLRKELRFFGLSWIKFLKYNRRLLYSLLANFAILVIGVSLIATSLAVFKKDINLISTTTSTTTTILTTTSGTPVVTTSRPQTTTTVVTTSADNPSLDHDDKNTYISLLLFIIGTLALLLELILIVFLSKKFMFWSKQLRKTKEASIKPSNVSIISSTVLDIEQTDL